MTKSHKRTQHKTVKRTRKVGGTKSHGASKKNNNNGASKKNEIIKQNFRTLIRHTSTKNYMKNNGK